MYTVCVYCIDTPTKIEEVYNVDKYARMNHTESRVFLIENINIFIVSCQQYIFDSEEVVSHPTKSEKMTIYTGINHRPTTNRVIVRHIEFCMHERLLDEARGTKRLQICL
jgi:hypothetical protein